MNTNRKGEVAHEHQPWQVVESQELLDVAGGVMAELDEQGNILRTCTDARPPYPAISSFKRNWFSY
ncbi:MAG: hypothetical protein AB7F89_06390 [Pirellulaceae bacterium]